MKTLMLLFAIFISVATADITESTKPSVRIVSGDPHRAVISWNPNPETNIYGYFIYLIRMDQPNMVNRRLFVTNTSVEVTDFEPGVEYSVSVAATNTNYQTGPACSPVRFFPSPKSLHESVLWKAELVGTTSGVLKASRDLKTWYGVTNPFIFDPKHEPRIFIRGEY